MIGNRSLLLYVAFGLVVLAAAADVAWLAPQLPERVATKFGAAGLPTAWSNRAQYLTWHIGGLAFSAVLFLGIRLALGWLPASTFNLPHRDYWLAPEREQMTRQALGDLLLGLGCGVLALLTVIGHLVMRANLAPEPRLSRAFAPVVLLWVGGMAALGTGFYLRFRRPR